MRGWAWWLISAVLLVLLAIAALGFAFAFLDPNDYKTQIVAAVEQATGRTLTVGGPLRISGSLWPTIEVTDVMLANLPGGTRPDLARAERIQALPRRALSPTRRSPRRCAIAANARHRYGYKNRQCWDRADSKADRPLGQWDCLVDRT